MLNIVLEINKRLLNSLSLVSVIYMCGTAKTYAYRSTGWKDQLMSFNGETHLQIIIKSTNSKKIKCSNNNQDKNLVVFFFSLFSKYTYDAWGNHKIHYLDGANFVALDSTSCYNNSDPINKQIATYYLRNF